MIVKQAIKMVIINNVDTRIFILYFNTTKRINIRGNKILVFIVVK